MNLLTLAGVLALAGAAQADRTDDGDPGVRPEVRSGEIRVLDVSSGHPRPCPPIDMAAAGFVKGGCTATLYAFSLKIAIRTAFGEMPFGSCTTTFDAHIAADGRLVLDRLRIGGAAPCNDLWPCAPAAVVAKLSAPTDQLPLARATPWRGRLTGRSGEAYAGSVAWCVDSCLGRYAGRLELELRETETGEWRLQARRAGVGSSGMQVDGEWSVDGPNFAIRAGTAERRSR